MEGRCIHEAQVFLQHAGGYRLPVIVRTSPITDQNGIVIGAVETFSDNSQLIAALKEVDELLDSIPGVNKRLAEVLMAEIGTDMRLEKLGHETTLEPTPQVGYAPKRFSYQNRGQAREQ